ncbi:MAG: transcriptional regulator [Gemmatimonadota bacterium]|nr:transcriptional regulator [Gemmatimonadota bacterium]
MKTVPLKLLTIIAEAVLEDHLIREIRGLGARGYSRSEVTGEGTRGVRASDWEGRNVKIEVLTGPEVADRILEHVAGSYFEHYAVVAYVQDVQVVRGEKYR